MTEGRQNKLIKTFISFIATFLIVVITVLILRALTLNIEANNNPVHIFMKDYFDVMLKKTEEIASKFKIRRNSVSEYQINLISQSVEDYINLSKYQTYEIAKSFDPNKKLNSASIDTYKENFYKITLENPYVRGLTFFDDKGQMKLNLFSVKGFTLEITENLMDEVKKKKSMVLHAKNENILYIISYMQNESGAYYVATRNDYMFVTDIVSYYQIAEKDFILTDSHNISLRIEQNDMAFVEAKATENVSSIISKYAYYKKEPAFTIGNESNLNVTMVGKNYPDYFEIILISLTAFFIVAAQKLIMLLIYLIKKSLPIKFAEKDEIKGIKTASLIDKAIIKSQQREFAYDGPSFDDEDIIDGEEESNIIENTKIDKPISDNYFAGSILSDNETVTFNEREINYHSTIEKNQDKYKIEECHTEENNILKNENIENFKVENNIETDILKDIDDVILDPNTESTEIKDEGIEKYNSTVSNSYVNADTIDSDRFDGVNKIEVKKYSKDVSEIFASFDALLESIISKAEEKVKNDRNMDYSNRETDIEEQRADNENNMKF